MLDKFSFEIVERLAILSENNTGNYTLELNRISFNGAAPKLDLRKWDKAKGKMLKGITLTDEEARNLRAALNKTAALE